MPIPTPKSGESQQGYVKRAHEALYKEFPDTDQRNAVIFETWRKHHGESEEEKKAHSRFSEDEYEHLRDIPVFKEHSYVRVQRNPDGTVKCDKDGNPIQTVETYGYEELKSIVDNCNRRVVETGSFAPITDVHTGKPRPDRQGFVNPGVLGFAGPYRLGMLGNEEREDGKPYKGKWAIYADEFWFKDKAHKAREMPRRSPEVYVGRPIHDRFLDPITALGAETPALDMGIHYHLNSKRELVECYSAPNITVNYAAACMPGPTNVSPPKEVNEPPVQSKKNKVQYEEDPELEAIHQKSQAWHKENIDFHTAELEKAKQAGDKQAIDKHKLHLAWHNRELKAGRAMHDKKAGIQDMGEGPLEITRHQLEQELAESIQTALYSADPDTVNACVNAMMNTQIIKRMESFLNAQDAPVNPKEEQQMEAASEIEQEIEQQPTSEAAMGKQADNPVGEEEEAEPNDQPEQPTIAGNPPAAMEQGKPTGEVSGKSPAGKGKKMDDKEKYEYQEFVRNTQIKLDELTTKYDQQQTIIADLQGQNRQLTAERDTALRSSKIMDLRRAGYVFDERQAIAKYSQASEEVFQTWADTVVSSAERVPMNAPTIFTPSLDVPVSQQQEMVGQYGGCSLSEAEEIAQYSIRKQAEGEYLTWDEAKEKVQKKRAKRA